MKNLWQNSKPSRNGFYMAFSKDQLKSCSTNLEQSIPVLSGGAFVVWWLKHLTAES